MTRYTVNSPADDLTCWETGPDDETTIVQFDGIDDAIERVRQNMPNPEHTDVVLQGVSDEGHPAFVLRHEHPIAGFDGPGELRWTYWQLRPVGSEL